MPDDYGMLTPDEMNKLPSWEQYALGAMACIAATEAEDQEDTVMVQLTLPELAMMMFGLGIAGRMFPELFSISMRLGHKMHELTEAQQFFENDDEDPE